MSVKEIFESMEYGPAPESAAEAHLSQRAFVKPPRDHRMLHRFLHAAAHRLGYCAQCRGRHQPRIV